MDSSVVEGEECLRQHSFWDVFLDHQWECSAAVNVKPAQCVLFVLDLFQRHEPFGDRMTVKGPDAMSEKSIGPRVDHVVSKRWQVDHSSVFVIGDH